MIILYTAVTLTLNNLNKRQWFGIRVYNEMFFLVIPYFLNFLDTVDWSIFKNSATL